MSDRGEKIINLAREMLRSDMEFELPQQPVKQPAITLKILCLATALTAVGSYAISEIAHESQRPINRYERTELNALVFYAARQKGLSEDSLRGEIESKFGVTNLNDMASGDFHAIRRYLQERAQ